MKRPKQVHHSRRRSYPPRRNRPPWPMSAKERLYERRKRRRNTRIKSEYLKWFATAIDYCQFCPELENEACWSLNSRYCLYEREAHAYYMRVRADVRFHRPTRKERLYERKKRNLRRISAYYAARYLTFGRVGAFWMYELPPSYRSLVKHFDDCWDRTAKYATRQYLLLHRR